MDFSLKARTARMMAVQARQQPMVYRHGTPAYKTNVKRNVRRTNGYTWFYEAIGAISAVVMIWLFFYVVMSL